MKLASYIGTRRGIRGITNWLIRLRLRGDASHCEVVFEPGDGVDHLMPDGTCQPDDQGRLWSFSSVGLERLPALSKRRAGKMGGARFKRINFTDAAKWELSPVDSQPLYAAVAAKNMEGARYDWIHIGSFASWLIGQSKTRFSCGEACAKLLGFTDENRFDPCSLRAVVKSKVISKTT